MPRKFIILTAILFCQPTAAATPERNGEAILRMCQGAERVRALSVMCHNYLNGFIDATTHDSRHGGRNAKFCLGEGDKEHIPVALVDWMQKNPDAKKLLAGEMLHRMLGERFPCKGHR